MWLLAGSSSRWEATRVCTCEAGDRAISPTSACLAKNQTAGTCIGRLPLPPPTQCPGNRHVNT